MTPAWAWPLLILGLTGWVLAAVQATVIAIAVIQARKTTAPDDVDQHADEAIAVIQEGRLWLPPL